MVRSCRELVNYSDDDQGCVQGAAVILEQRHVLCVHRKGRIRLVKALPQSISCGLARHGVRARVFLPKPSEIVIKHEDNRVGGGECVLDGCNDAKVRADGLDESPTLSQRQRILRQDDESVNCQEKTVVQNHRRSTLKDGNLESA